MRFEIERIDKLCKERGWSHYRLAKEMNMEPNKVGNLFLRESTPTVHTLRRVCEAFGITLSQFFLDDEENIILSKEQTDFLRKYMTLSKEQRRRLEAYMDGMRAESLGDKYKQ